MTRNHAIEELKQNICPSCSGIKGSSVDDCDIHYCDVREAIRTLESEKDLISRKKAMSLIDGLIKQLHLEGTGEVTGSFSQGVEDGYYRVRCLFELYFSSSV